MAGGVKKFLGRLANPMAQVAIDRQKRAIARKRPRIARLQHINRELRGPRKGEYWSPERRAARQVIQRKAKAGKYR